MNTISRNFLFSLVGCTLGLASPAFLSAAFGQTLAYNFTNLAGMGVSSGSTDGTGSAARFLGPAGVAVDNSGNVYVADSGNDTIRKITAAGVVTTFAGTAGTVGSADGTGSAALFNGPQGIAVDRSGNVYVADSGNNTIRMITPGGVVTTFAGTAGTAGSADGTGSAAQFAYPFGLAIDPSGNVYVSDADNHTIRKISPAGAVTTLAGTAGINGYANGTGSAASFAYPTGIAIDNSGNLYVADDTNYTIRKITPAGAVSTFAGTHGNAGAANGTGGAASFGITLGVAIDSSGNLYVADSGNDTIRMITSAAVVTTFAGAASIVGSVDGTRTAARFNFPTGVAVGPSGSVYVADSGNNIIRKISSTAVTTFAGTTSAGSTDGTGSAAKFYYPTGVAVDSSANLYVADSVNDTLRKISPAGAVTTFAGTAGSSGSADGTGSAARFSNPFGAAVDGSGNIYVTDSGNSTIRMITPAATVTTFAGMAGSSGSADGTGSAARFLFPRGIAVDSAGNLYVADSGNSTVRKITAAGAVTTLAGTVGLQGSADGTGGAARFSSPFGVAVDGSGNVYVTDAGNSTIREITSAGVVTTIAGTAGSSGYADGTGGAAQFSTPEGIAIDSAGNLYVADSGNSTIRKIAPGGVVTTIAGTAGSNGWVNGTGSAAEFNVPLAIALDSSGDVYVADTSNNAIRLGVPQFTPAITGQPQNLTVDVGQNATFQVTATGTALSYVWQDSTDGGATWSTLTDGGDISGSTTANLTITDAGSSLNGTEYQVVAANLVGSQTSNAAILSVDSLPAFTTQPSAQTVTAQGTATFTAAASGVPTPTYQWQQSANGGASWANVTNGNGVSGSATANLTIANASVALNGNEYQVIATNAAGSQTSNAATLSVDTLPAFTAQPAAQTVTAPGTATFTAAASGVPTPTYRWQQSTNGGVTWTNLSDGGGITGSATGTLTIASASVSLSGNEYQVIATNAAGTLTSTAVMLTVNSLPAFTTQPTSQTVTANGTAGFTAAASGVPAPTYQWQQSTNGGATWTNLTDGSGVSGSATGALTIANASVSLNGNEYQLVATNLVGSQTSNAATLSVHSLPAFTTQPTAQTVSANGPASFTAAATGVPTPAYQWQQSTNGGASWTNLTDGNGISGSATGTLTIANASVSLNGNEYQAIATNAVGTQISNAVTLTVTLLPVFTTQPAAETASAGTTATFTAVASGTPTPTYQWQQSTNGGATWSTMTDGNGVSGSATGTLTIANASLSLNGNQYQVIATNLAGTQTSNAATLTVTLLPVFTTQPAAQTVTAGGTATFMAVATAVPTPTYQWQQSTNSGASWSTLTDANGISGSATGTLTIANASNSLNGYEYQVVATNGNGSSTSDAATLTVNSLPAFTTQPTAQTVTAGGTATFSAAANGVPTPTYRWQQSTDGTNWTSLTDGNGILGSATATLTIANASASLNGYEYRATATNVVGPQTSAAATLTVNSPPAFTTQPSAQTVTAGGTAIFSTTATGVPAPTYQWQKSTNGGATWANLIDGSGITGSATVTLTIANASLSLNGSEYQVVATNLVGSQTSNAATLSVQSLPAFTTQPTAQTVTAGGAATFTAAVSGVPAPTYQWQLSTNGGTTWSNLTNGNGVSGSTSGTLTIANAALSLNGDEYQLIATNAAGSQTSSAVTLTVNSPPAFTTQPTAQTISAGGTATFMAVATGGPTPSYQWQRSTDGGATWTNVTDGNGVSGSATGTLTIATVSVALGGSEYRVIATNTVGSATSSSATLGVGLASQTITFTPIGAVTVNVPVILNATASSGLAVTFSVQSGNAAIANGNSLTVNDVNPVTILASQPGNASFAAAAGVTQTLSANPGAGQEGFGQIGGQTVTATHGSVRPFDQAAVNTTLAAYLNGSGTGGTLIGYISSIQAGFLVNFSLSDGSFTAATTSLTSASTLGRTLTFVGAVANGQVSGTIEELNLAFSATFESASGSSSAVSGLYEAPGASGGDVFSIVGTQGDVFVLADTAGGISAGTGTIDANNTIRVTTSLGASATITASINPGTNEITGTFTPAVGGALNFSGESSVSSPTVTPAAQTVAAGASPVLTLSGAGTYQWQFNGADIPGATSATLTLHNIGTNQAGTYSAVVTSGTGAVAAASATVEVTTDAHLINLSSRSYVGTSSQVLVAGFSVSGTGTKQVLIRGDGPVLTGFDVTGALAHPQLTLFDHASAAISTNTGWGNASVPGPSTSSATIGLATTSEFDQVYAFHLPPGSADCAVFAGLPASTYTAQISGVGNTSGVALAELYDADTGTPTAHLINLSARAFVNTGSGVLVAGFSISGTSSETVLIRGIGPTLANFNVPGALAAPQLTLYDNHGNVIATNTGWNNAPVLGASTVPAGVQAATASVMSSVYAFGLSNGSADCAMVVTLPPGVVYTAQESGLNNTTGIGLIEVYEVP